MNEPSTLFRQTSPSFPAFVRPGDSPLPDSELSTTHSAFRMEVEGDDLRLSLMEILPDFTHCGINE
ncbi:MAG: hypothetical protein EBS05_18875 [Proteobacteria bacterium]|nr:hypothetical protein [Pseudomonadota bacterium]